MKTHTYILIVLVACLSSCGNKYYEFSDAEEYMLPYEANDSVRYCTSSECGYLTVTRWNRYVGDDGYFLPATHSFDVKSLTFKNLDKNEYILWGQKKEDNTFRISIDTYFNQHSNEFYSYNNNTNTSILVYYERFIIKKRAFANVYELKGTDNSKFYFNSTQGFLMLTQESDTIFFGETLN